MRAGKLSLVGMLLWGGSLAVAQVPTASISGTVSDSSGAVLAGASVTTTNRETSLTRTVRSGADGHYHFSSLPVGIYDVKAEIAGFQSQLKQNLNLAVGQEAVLNFTLAVGTVQETISVTAEAPLVDTTSGALGGLVNEERVTELPLNGRSFNDLVFLQTGITVHHPASATSSTSIGTDYSSNGAPLRSNNIVLDGARLTSGFDGLTGNSISGLMLGVDAIREFRVLTNNFPAEYGMTMGSQMVIVSKSGTNRVHGSIFDFLRNSVVDARNFFARTNPPYHRNNFGGSLGGPIRKDKDFFFVSYEGLRELLGVPLLLNVPNQRARTNGGLVAQISPSVIPYLNLYPLPNGVLANDPAGLLGVETYSFSFNQPTDENFGQFRVDHNFSERNQLFLRYTIDDARKITSAGNNPAQFQQEITSRSQYATLAESHIFSPAVLNTSRLSLSRPFRTFTYPPAPGTSDLVFLQGLGLQLGSMAPGSGVTSIGGGNNLLRKETSFTFSDDISWIEGKHSFKFGTLMNRYRTLVNGNTNRWGAFQFNSLQQFLLGVPSQVTFLAPGTISDRTYVWNTFGFYAQDEWRATSRLTLNVGLRYEFNTTVTEVTGRGSSVRNLLTDTTWQLTPALNKNPSLKNFGPRFGFAWDVLGDGKTAIRGGFGILSDIANLTSASDVENTGMPPFSSTVVINNGLCFPSCTVVPSINQIVFGTGGSLRMIEYNQAQPRLLSYNFTLERQLPGSMMISVGYAGSRGINILQTIDGNPTLPQVLPGGTEFWTGTDRRRNPAFSFCECKTSGGSTWYNSLQMSLQKRVSHGLEFQVSYTFSKMLDNTQGQHGGEAGGSSVTGTDPLHLKTDQGPTDFNIPHYFAFNTLYKLPSPATSGIVGGIAKGWRVGTILTIQSGLPFTANLSGNRSRSNVLGGGTGNPDRPNLVSECRMIRGGPDQYFNPACFSIQPVGFLGSAGRNIMMGPLHSIWNFSLMKDIPIRYLGEGRHFEFRAEFFNLLNHADFNIPLAGRTVYTATPTSASSTPLSTAGQISSTIGPAREIQFALKFIF